MKATAIDANAIEANAMNHDKPATENTVTTDVWEQFHQRLFSLIQKKVTDRAEAEDILQDVFLRIHRHAQRLDTIRNVNAWVYRITHNAISDHFRDNARKFRTTPLRADESADTLVTDHTDEPLFSVQELSDCIRPLVMTLAPKYRDALLLTELGDLSQKSAALKMGISASGMKSRVQRGRKKLKAALQDCCHFELGTQGRLTPPDNSFTCTCPERIVEAVR